MIYKSLLAVAVSGFTLVGCSTLPPGETSGALPTESALQEIADAPAESVAPAEEQAIAAEPVDLWQRMRNGYQLPKDDNPRVQKYLEWYSKHPSYITRVTERGAPFLHYILEQLDARNMPLELALLPIVESAFDPFAYSHGRASGMWQFIPGTGKQYGLKQNWWYDGRRDPMAATDAALNYLSDLHRRLGDDWLLALASYNTGEGNVRRAQKRNDKKGMPTDFWSLDLPRETEMYVPQLIALAIIFENPEQYQITLSPVEDIPYFEAVDVGSQIDLAQAASMADISLDDLYKLNAGFNRWATDPQGPHRLLVPIDKAEGFREQLGSLPATQRVSWERYKVRSGDSLLGIAGKYNTTVETLREHNNIRGNLIRAGQMLLIPTASQPANAYTYSANQRLMRTQEKGSGASGSSKVTYQVRQGDSLWSISRKYNVSVRKLAKWNGMAPGDTLRSNQKLVIWTTSGAAATASNNNRNDGIIRKVAYQVRKGDSLARIAGKFNLSVNDILRWNGVNKNAYLQPGQSLTLFVDVTRAY